MIFIVRTVEITTYTRDDCQLVFMVGSKHCPHQLLRERKANDECRAYYLLNIWPYPRIYNNIHRLTITLQLTHLTSKRIVCPKILEYILEVLASIWFGYSFTT